MSIIGGEIFGIAHAVISVSEPEAAGTYRVERNGCDNAGQPVSSGMYLYRLQASKFV